jgi:peptidoglycan/LPS O-acetylase OafA/YrhL
VSKYTPLLEAAKEYEWILNTLADPVMTFGFSLILLSVLLSENQVLSFLKSKLVIYLGKISFSIYLWHSLVLGLVTQMISTSINSLLHPILLFILVTLVTVFIAHFSYRFLELPYFKRKQHV